MTISKETYEWYKKNGYDVSGLQVGNTETTPSDTSSSKVNPNDVYSYLRDKGLSDAHAKGILANIQQESGFNPGARGDGGTSGGLFQHHAERLTALNDYAPNWQTDWKKQVDFALDEPDGQQYAKQQFSTPEEATSAFTLGFERPANARQEALKRIQNLNNLDVDSTYKPDSSPYAGSAISDETRAFYKSRGIDIDNYKPEPNKGLFSDYKSDHRVGETLKDAVATAIPPTLAFMPEKRLDRARQIAGLPDKLKELFGVQEGADYGNKGLNFIRNVDRGLIDVGVGFPAQFVSGLMTAPEQTKETITNPEFRNQQLEIAKDLITQPIDPREYTAQKWFDDPVGRIANLAMVLGLGQGAMKGLRKAPVREFPKGDVLEGTQGFSNAEIDLANRRAIRQAIEENSPNALALRQQGPIEQPAGGGALVPVAPRETGLVRLEDIPELKVTKKELRPGVTEYNPLRKQQAYSEVGEEPFSSHKSLVLDEFNVKTSPPLNKAESLSDFVRKSGGINDTAMGGEITRLGTIKESGISLKKNDGLPVDTLREIANENGYGPYETVNDFIDALDTDIFYKRQNGRGVEFRASDYEKQLPERQLPRAPEKYVFRAPKPYPDSYSVKFDPKTADLKTLISKSTGGERGALGELTPEQTKISKAEQRAAQAELYRRAGELAKEQGITLDEALKQLAVPKVVTMAANLGKKPENERLNAGLFKEKINAEPIQTPNLNLFKDDLKTKIVRKMENNWVDVKNLQEQPGIKVGEDFNPAQAKKLMPGRVSARIEPIDNEIIKIDKKLVSDAKKYGVDNNKIVDDVNTYLQAQHAPERNAALGDGAAGMTNAEAVSTLEALKGKKEFTAIKEAADKLLSINKKVLETLKEGQVISPELYDTLTTKYKNHVPLQRIFEDTENIADVLNGRGLDVRSTGIKAAKGSTREVSDIMGNILANAKQAVVKAEKNKVDLEILKFARENKGTGIFEEVKPPKIPVEIEHKAGIDKVFIDKLAQFANSLGGKFKTGGQPNSKLGQYGGGVIERKFATPREVSSHEVGHFIDEKFGLVDQILRGKNSRAINQEVKALMDEMGESHKRKGDLKERLADAFEWWLTNRSLAEKDIPLFSKRISEIISKEEKLTPLLEMRPSPRISVEKMREKMFVQSPFGVNDPQVLTLREGGKPVYLKINNPQLAKVLKGLNVEPTHAIVRYIGKATQLFSQLFTRYNPEFLASNKIRDINDMFDYVSSHKGFGQAIKSAFKSLSPENYKIVIDHMRGKDTPGTKLYQQFLDDGGTTGGIALSTRENVLLDVDNIRKLNRSKPRQAAKAILSTIDNVNNVFENSTRFAVYKEALARGQSRRDAAELAKTASIDFNQHGEWGPFINSLYMFSNAGIQGLGNSIRSIKNNPKAAAGKVAIMTTGLYFINQYNNMVDPKWRDKVSEWDYMNGVNVMVPTDSGAMYVTIPIGWGIRSQKVLAQAVTDFIDDSETVSGASKKMVNAIAQSANPLGGGDLVQTLTPTLGDLPVDMARNKGWHGGMIKPDFDKNAPEASKYFKSLKKDESGKFFIGLSKGLYKYHLADVSPADLNYAYEQLLGGTGKFATKIVDTGGALLKGESPEVKDIPFASRFLRSKTDEQLNAQKKRERENNAKKKKAENRLMRGY